MSAVRVRYSPAPTGSMHVGNARTALFNWLYARHTGGTFVVRIEDTDADRSTDASIRQALDVLDWLGLRCDEGPYRQSERADRHRKAAAQLLADGNAYECYCTKAELGERGAAAKAAGRPPGYDNLCRDLDDATRAERRSSGGPVTIRFRTPLSGRSEFDDVVRGHVSVPWSTIADFVILRPDGAPVFYLANAVDDLDMEITHVIRGEDILDTTHRVLAIRGALSDEPPPRYAHCPLILGPDGHKLSKRYGAVSVEEFRDAGYLPQALVNFLARLGWGTADGDEVMSPEQIAELFDIIDITHSAATFDTKKLEWMNGEHIRRMSTPDLVAAVLPFAEARSTTLDRDVFAAAVALAQERAVTLLQIAEQCAFLFVADADFEIAPQSWDKIVQTDRVGELFDAVIRHLEHCAWEIDAIDLRPILLPLGLKPRHALPAVYAAIEGSHAGLPLFDSIQLLQRERALARMRAARARLTDEAVGGS